MTIRPPQKRRSSVELRVAERLMLLNLLPQEGDIPLLRVIREAQTVIGLSEEELKVLELKQEGERVFWKSEADVVKDIKIGATATRLLQEKLESLNAADKLGLNQLALYEKFVGAEPAKPKMKAVKSDA